MYSSASPARADDLHFTKVLPRLPHTWSVFTTSLELTLSKIRDERKPRHCLAPLGSVAGLQCGLGFAKTIFWGKGFGKTSADFPPAERGLGRNPRGLRFRILADLPN